MVVVLHPAYNKEASLPGLMPKLRDVKEAERIDYLELITGTNADLG